MALILSGACDGVGSCAAQVAIDPQWMPSASGCYDGRVDFNDYEFSPRTSAVGNLVVHLPTASTPPGTVTGFLQSGTGQFGFLEGFSFEAVRSGPPSGSCLPPPTVSNAPTIGNATSGYGQATVSWEAPTSDGGSAITAYWVTAYIGYFPEKLVTFSSTATTQVVTGLTNGVTYRFKVRAVNAAGLSPFSRASNPVTPAPTLPGPPTIDRVVIGSDRQATVAWLAPASDGGSAITGYVVTPYIGYYPLPAQTFMSTATMQTATGLSNGTTYRFRVQAINTIGTGGYSKVTNPVTLGPGALTGVTAITAGDRHRCALLAGGAVKCWGYNDSGQLGDGTTTDRLTAVTVTGLGDATAIAAGYNGTCAIVTGGAVKCWGGFTAQQVTPLAVAGISGATAITAGSGHTCAIVAGGEVRCWGSNLGGRLGDGTTTSSATPVAVTGISGATAISAGAGHTCALLADGAVKCWGYGTNGQLGDGTTNFANPTPTAVTGINDATAVTAGPYHTCAVLTGGAINCWGRNIGGQLGDGSTTDRATPVAGTGISNATAVAGGSYHSCALLAGGAINCWGNNISGVTFAVTLGDGSGTPSPTPVAVYGISDATAVSANQSHTCALVTGGAVKCWGSGYDGQLGDGSAGYRLAPVLVLTD